LVGSAPKDLYNIENIASRKKRKAKWRNREKQEKGKTIYEKEKNLN